MVHALGSGWYPLDWSAGAPTACQKNPKCVRKSDNEKLPGRRSHEAVTAITDP